MQYASMAEQSVRQVRFICHHLRCITTVKIGRGTCRGMQDLKTNAERVEESVKEMRSTPVDVLQRQGKAPLVTVSNDPF